MEDSRAGAAWLGQLVRFGIVGVATNALLYAIFLVLLHLGVEPVVAMTLTYAAGVLGGFMLNRQWTFAGTGGRWSSALGRYAVAHAAGYGLNLFLLIWLVEWRGLPAAHVQAVAIVVIALLMFIAQRVWVFRARDHRTV